MVHFASVRSGPKRRRIGKRNLLRPSPDKIRYNHHHGAQMGAPVLPRASEEPHTEALSSETGPTLPKFFISITLGFRNFEIGPQKN